MPEPSTFDEELVVLTVDYGRKTVGVSEEAVRIHYSMKGKGDPRKARQVRWVVRDLEPDDSLRIRPKSGHSPSLFNRGRRGVFEIVWPHNSIASGPPLDPFAKAEKTRVDWFYEIEVMRQGEQLFGKDPCVIIEREG